jgi:hypothetical protein
VTLLAGGEMFQRITVVSRWLHDLIWSGKSQSLCSRAWHRQGESAFWRAWVIVFGKKHCERSWRWWHERTPE